MDRLLQQMWAFQTLHSTEGRCLDNAVFLKDSLLASGRHARVQAVIATWTDASRVNAVVHMVVVDAVQGILGQVHLSAGGLSRRDAIAHFLDFIKHAKSINKGMILLSDKEYYNAQADFLGANRGVHQLRG